MRNCAPSLEVEPLSRKIASPRDSTVSSSLNSGLISNCGPVCAVAAPHQVSTATTQTTTPKNLRIGGHYAPHGRRTQCPNVFAFLRREVHTLSVARQANAR